MSKICNYCGKHFEGAPRVCSEDCFYGAIYYGTQDSPGVFASDTAWKEFTKGTCVGHAPSPQPEKEK